MKFNCYMVVDKFDRLILSDTARIRYEGNMPYLTGVVDFYNMTVPECAPHKIVRVVIDEV